MKDKFELTEYEAIERNKELLKTALDALYATFIQNEVIARHRGKAIQAINNMARTLGYPDIVRHG